MKRPVAYFCSELDADAWPDRCLDFRPSLAKTKKNRDFTQDAYDKFQRECQALRDDEAAFRAKGCKRMAHRQMPQGRQGARYGELVGPPRLGKDGLSYAARVSLPGRTPLFRRTQSPLAAPDKRQGAFALRREEEASAAARTRSNEERVLSILRREAGPDGRLALNRAGAERLLEQLDDLVIPERADALLAALGTRAERFFGPQQDEQGESTLPEVSRDLALQAEVLLSRTLATSLEGIEPLRVVSTDRGLHVEAGRRYRLLRVIVGDVDVGLAQILSEIGEASRRTTPDKMSDEARKKFYFATQVAFYRKLRRAMEELPGDVTFVFRGDNRELPVVVPRGELQHSKASAFVSRKRRPDYNRLTFLTLEELAAFLTKGATVQKRRTLRGRRLPPVTAARSNPMARPKFVNFPDYIDLQPGESRPIPADPLYCVYRKSGRNVHLLPLEAQFEITTCSRAQSWQRLNQRALSSSVTPRPPSPTLSQENPMARSRPNPPFDPLAELMAEYGPKARLGASQASLSPEFNDTYRASRSYGPYGLSDAPYGGQAMLPVNRRNPRHMARHYTGEPIDMNQKGLKWRDFVRAYGERRDTFIVPTPLASQKWAEYKKKHGIITDPKVAERLQSLKSRKARKNHGDMSETAPLSPWEHESEYELVRGAYGPGSEMPPVNRRNPRRNPAPEFTRYDDLSDAQLTFLSNTGDESASRELALRNPRSSGKRQKRQLQERVQAARAAIAREAEEMRYAQGSAGARARFEQEDRRREAERVGQYLAEQRSRDAEREAYLYNPRTRSQRELADARAYARTQMDDETARMMAEQAEDEKRDYVRRRVQLERKKAKGQYGPRHVKFGPR